MLVVVKMSLMTLLLLVMSGGREEPILWPPTMLRVPGSLEVQLFPIKIVPSLSMIVRWSQPQRGHMSDVSERLDLSVGMLNAVNCKDRMNPSSTCIVSVL